MKAKLKNFKQSPRKARLVAKSVRGKSVAHARRILSFMDQKSAPAILALINSALANGGIDIKDMATQERLLVKEIRVDEGMRLKRWMPRAFGRATPYRRRFSHVYIELAEKDKKDK